MSDDARRVIDLPLPNQVYRVRTLTIETAAAKLRLNRPAGRMGRSRRKMLERWAIRWCHRHNAAYAGRLEWIELPILDSAGRYLLIHWRAVPNAGSNLEAIEKVITPDPEHFQSFVNIAEPREVHP